MNYIFASEMEPPVIPDEPFQSVPSVEDAKANLVLNAPSIILIEKKSGDILYEKNAYQRMYPASTVKVLTAILTIENCNLNDIVTVSQNSVNSVPSGYTVSNILPGENLTIEDLLYATLVPSGNDAAYALAEHVGGSFEEFANMMNKKAIEIGCKDSNFTNPNGIHDLEMYTTAYDLALIGKYAMNNETFRKIVSSITYTLPATNIYPESDRVLNTSNHLINPNSFQYYQYSTGIKTGYTNAAQNCLVASAKKDSTEFIAVILGSTASNTTSQSKFNDAINLFEFAFTYYDNYKSSSPTFFDNIFNLESYVNPELLVDENLKPRWGYVAYLIARATLILITILYAGYLLIYKIKRYIYNRTHAKFKYRY